LADRKAALARPETRVDRQAVALAAVEGRSTEEKTEGCPDTCVRFPNPASKQHIVEGGRPFDQLIEQGQLEPLQGAKLEVSQAKGGVLVNDIEILKPDIVADNGAIHVIGGLRAPEKQIKPALNSSNEESPRRRENGDLASTAPAVTRTGLPARSRHPSACL
jgi:Fasciclin domain